ncbi:MAG: retropepsin-like aspartic protease [Aeromicrobium sp.]
MVQIPMIVTPDRDDPECANVMVDATIAGRPYRFVLDTGSPRTHIVADEFTATLARCGTHASSGVFSSSSNPFVTLPDLTIGTAPQGKVEAVSVDPSQSDVRNLLGMDVLKRHCWHFRFDTQTLTIETARSLDGMRTLIMDAVFHPYVELSWHNAIAQCVWDSGADITVVDRAFWLKHPGMFHEVGSSLGIDANGVQFEVLTFAMAEVEIGGQLFAPHKVAVVDLSQANAELDLPMDLVLGYTTLNQANWLFDFPAKRWCVTNHGP